MIKMNDNEFDRAFRDRVLTNEPAFDEAAWNQLERKLNKRDRVLLFRNATVIACLLALISASYYFTSTTPSQEKPSIVKVRITEPIKANPLSMRSTAPSGIAKDISDVPVSEWTIPHHITPQPHYIAVHTHRVAPYTRITDSIAFQTQAGQTGITTNRLVAQNTPDADTSANGLSASALPSSEQTPRQAKRGKRLRQSLALAAGPEFNSVASVLGGKPGFAAGLLLSLGITENLSLQTGLRYSKKEYNASGYDYQFRNAGTRNIITNIDASCGVLEIPILASYTISDNRSRSIELNAGVSSYFMLREDYHFKYSPQSGIPDRLSQTSNKNQHYLAVIDLSATYYLKLKKERFRLGLEPFLKLPISGVGEGNINLKSNGVSFKLRYDLHK